MAEQLTDKELRKELSALGEVSVGPITDTTRPLYLRKLKSLRGNQKATASTPRRRFASKKLLGFSSDESGDDAPAPPAGGGGESVERGSTLRRAKASYAAAKTTPAANRRSPGRQRSKPESQSERIPRERPSPVLPLSRRSLRSTSRTVITVPELKRESPPNVAPASYFGPLHSTAIDAGVSTSVIRHTVNNDTFEFSDSDDMDILDLDVSDDHEDSDAGKLGSDTNNSSAHMVTTGINTSSWLDNTLGSLVTSFTSNKSSRSVAGTSVYNRFTPQMSPLSQNLRPASPGDREPCRGINYEPSSAKTKAKPSNPVRMASESKQSFALHISTFLLILAVFFFILLAFAYLNVTSSTATDVVSRKQLICTSSDKSGKSLCQEAEVPLVLVKSIVNMLAIRAGNYDCGAEELDRNMSLVEVEEELRKIHGPKSVDNNMEKAIELIQMNPHWKIRLLDTTGDMLNKDKSTVVAMESEQSNMSFLCRLNRSARFVGYVVVIAVIAAFVVTLVIAAMRYQWRERERKAQEVYKIVEQIIDILQRHCGENEGKDGMKPYLAIPHVRDMLIAPAERAQKQAMWDKAVKFLSANESRVRVETQKIHGEEFAVWRWLQPVPNGSRVWQGQAFGEYRDTSLNAPPCSSTPCLKIRNMFDPDIEYGDDWHIYVQDAILEKCSSNHSILHIAVDRNSKEGCVYVKFATPESAGRAFKALHGWWFDGNLVTVKYLRLERYHERFPDSIGLSAYMQPSNSQKKSLSVPFYRSVLETS